jgi:hypothetical protein
MLLELAQTSFCRSWPGVLHREEVAVGTMAKLVDLDEVRMAHVRDGAKLAFEPHYAAPSM